MLGRARVFPAEGEHASPAFHAIEPPTTADVAGLLRTVARRTIRLLRRTGKLDDLGGLDLGLDDPCCLDTCYAAAAQGKIPFGPHTGATTPRVGNAPITETSRTTAARCATLAGFSLHAGGAPAKRSFVGRVFTSPRTRAGAWRSCAATPPDHRSPKSACR